jgi:NADP-dependent 3-hydroxy acid dehydrogenase YdfG
MRAHKKGTIINVSSLSDRRARPQNPVYAATKAAVASLTESLRMANASMGIRFCNIAPAKIHSPMWDEPFNPVDFVNAETFAETLLWIYQQPQAVCIRDMLIAPTNYEP